MSGIITHELLQWICTQHPHTLEVLPWLMISNRLKTAGFNEAQQTAALATLRTQMQTLWEEPIARWICQRQEEEKNEYEFLIEEKGKILTKIIDRTFLYEGERWIIDFKTGSNEEHAQQSHRTQVNDYAKWLSLNSPQPIRCGLYYLASNTWIQWHYQGSLATL